MFISMCTQTHLQGTGWGGHLLAFSKALIKGMAEHTEGMGKERKKNNDSWGLAKAECRYHKFMSARFEALPRQCDAKWLVLLPRVFVPVYLRAQCCCFSVCMHPCVIFERVPPPHLSSLFRRMNTGWLCECSCLCQTHPELGGNSKNFKNKFSEHMLYWEGRFKDIVSYHIPEIDSLFVLHNERFDILWHYTI